MSKDYAVHVEGDWGDEEIGEVMGEDTESTVVVLFSSHEINRRQGLLVVNKC